MFSIPGGAGELDDVFDGVPLTEIAKAVYAAAVRAAHEDGRFSFGDARARVGCTVRELVRALMELDVFRFLSFEETYDEAGFHYRFCFPDDGDEPYYVEAPDGPWRVDYSAFSTRQGWAMLDAPPSVKLVLAFLHASVGGLDRRVAISQGEIAEYTGLSRAAVSKVLKWLADNRVIYKRGSRNGDGGTDVCRYGIAQSGVLCQFAH